MSLITENNRQYYEGAQTFRGDGNETNFTTTFDTNLKWYGASTAVENYALNNFKLYESATGVPGSYSEVLSGYTVVGNTIAYSVAPANNLYIVVQLKTLDGGKYASTISEKAYGNTVEENYGSYSYITLNDIINNFLVAYVGNQKLIPSVKRNDLIFFAKRGLQEFSYDTLKSIKSQELTIPQNLSVIIPQDYVNYVSVAWYDKQGVKHPIYPVNNLTNDPYTIPLQDGKGVPIQDVYDDNIGGTSIVEERWRNNAYKNLNELINNTWLGYELFYGDWGWGLYGGWGELYGLNPQYANANGWFSINEREGKFSFSADLRDKIIILEYISDGLAYDLDTKVPKLAEEAMYAYILHAIISGRANQPEYIVARLKKEKSAKLRNAKIRLSNIKLEEITQVMRGKSKWIKH